MKNIKSEIVASYERNGKMYVILELDISGSNQFFPDLPDWADFNVSITYENRNVCLVITYDDKKWEQCITVNECYEQKDIDIFSIGIGKIYLKTLSICPTEKGAHVSLQVWIKAGPLDTKIGEYSKDVQ